MLLAFPSYLVDRYCLCSHLSAGVWFYVSVAIIKSKYAMIAWGTL